VHLLCLEHPSRCETSAPDSIEIDFLDNAGRMADDDEGRMTRDEGSTTADA
jgi:hypothetical protein